MEEVKREQNSLYPEGAQTDIVFTTIKIYMDGCFFFN